MTTERERAPRDQSDKFTALMLKQTAVLRAQMRSNRWWTVGTTIAVGLALAALIIARG